MKRNVLYILGLIWSAPIQLISALIFFIFWNSGQLRYRGILYRCLIFTIEEKTWLRNLFRNYKVSGIGWCSFIGTIELYNPFEYHPPERQEIVNQFLNHEVRHSQQALLFGFLFPVFYVLASIIAWIDGKDLYVNNFFEKDARGYAGQE